MMKMGNDSSYLLLTQNTGLLMLNVFVLVQN